MSKSLINILIIYQFLYFVFLPLLAWSQTSQSRSGKNSSTELKAVSSFGIFQDLNKGEKTEESIGISAISPTGPGASSPLYYHIHVLGEVLRPGTYRILPSDRVTDALKYAGGIMSVGSKKRIELRRKGKYQLFDIYSYKYNGDLSQNPYMMENDVIFVPVKKGEIQVEGPVNRPGNYEVLKIITLKEAIGMAGGFAAGLSLTEPIRVIRFDAEGKKNILEVANLPESLSKFKIVKGDIIVVSHFLIADKKFDYNVSRIPGDNIFYPTINDSVYVVGAVSIPGPYAFQPTFRAKDYVSQAGPDDKASLGRIKVISADGKKRSVSKMYAVNAGDTIVVPAKGFTFTSFVTLFGALTSMALTSLVFYDRFAND